MSDEKKLECSFCGKGQHEVKRLIAGPSAHICDDCVDLCAGILKQEQIDAKDKDLPKPKDGTIPSPKKIREFLDQYIIGQDYAKMVVSVAVANHYKRITTPIIDDVELEKSNILMIGPSGAGKTLMGQTIARMLDVPFVIADATGLTESGYVGDDVESIITRLVQSANYDIKKAERGIVYIDEIDKKAKKESSSGTRDVSGEGVQQGLLKILEGAEIRIPANGAKKNSNQEMITINTKNILFIVGGAFVHLDKIVEKRMNKATSIGFGSEIKTKKNEFEMAKLLENIESEDLVNFGLIPELVGRIPVIAHLHELTEEQLIQVLTEPKNSITKQFGKLFGLDKIELEFTDDALHAIAKVAKLKKVGARGLRSIIEHKLIPVQYELPELHEKGVIKITVDKNSIDSSDAPSMEYEHKNEA
jgi:ATP-dependent Clp protease ATP-binding subunit ClpX